MFAFEKTVQVRSCEEARHASVRKLSASLLAAKSPATKAIRKKMEEIQRARELLEEELQSRELTLNSAAEIHCFNKDVQDLLRRINEKELVFAGSAATDSSKDFQSCETLRRKHEIFKEELTALKVGEMIELERDIMLSTLLHNCGNNYIVKLQLVIGNVVDSITESRKK